MVIVSNEKMNLIETHDPELPKSVRNLGQAVAVVRQLIERECLAPRVVCAVADPMSMLSFEEVRMVTIVDGDGIRDKRSADPIYTKEGADLRLRLVMGITALQESGNLGPFDGVNDLVGTVYHVWQFRLVQSMRKVCDVGLEYIGALAAKSDSADGLVGELAAAVAKYNLIQTGALPPWAPPE